MITKGEWTHIEDGVIVAEDGRQIASVFPRAREANAQLIAAAPDLYEALKDLIDCLTINYEDKDVYITKAQQALAKAEVK